LKYTTPLRELNPDGHRSVVLDTETTGMPVTDGHRIIEIGCVELIGRRLTGRHFHVYLQPDRESDEGAIGVHGITDEFLRASRVSPKWPTSSSSSSRARS
jgi:DNA polymerase III epsilon subunit-like protein